MKRELLVKQKNGWQSQKQIKYFSLKSVFVFYPSPSHLRVACVASFVQ